MWRGLRTESGATEDMTRLTSFLPSAYVAAAVARGPTMQMSEAIPFMEKPKNIDAAMPGMSSNPAVGMSESKILTDLALVPSHDGWVVHLTAS